MRWQYTCFKILLIYQIHWTCHFLQRRNNILQQSEPVLVMKRKKSNFAFGLCLSQCRLLKQKHHRLGLNNKHVFLTVLEAKKFKFKSSVDLVSGESLLPGSQKAIFALGPHMAEKGERTLWGSLCKGTNPTPEGYSIMTSSSPKGSISNTNTLEIGFQHMNFGRTQTSSPQQHSVPVPHNVTLFGSRTIADAIV